MSLRPFHRSAVLAHRRLQWRALTTSTSKAPDSNREAGPSTPSLEQDLQEGALDSDDLAADNYGDDELENVVRSDDHAPRRNDNQLFGLRKKGSEQKGFVEQHPIFIRPWDGIASLAHALAILREIERRYGRIKEFRLIRDLEVRGYYQPFFWASFAEAESLARIGGGTNIEVPEPAFDTSRTGGVGLDDIQDMLQSTAGRSALPLAPLPTSDSYVAALADEMKDTIVDGAAGGRKNKIIYVRLEKAGGDWVSVQDPPAAQMSTVARRKALAHAFLDWGGFYRPGSDPKKRTRQYNAMLSAIRRSQTVIRGPVSPTMAPVRDVRKREPSSDAVDSEEMPDPELSQMASAKSHAFGRESPTPFQERLPLASATLEEAEQTGRNSVTRPSHSNKSAMSREDRNLEEQPTQGEQEQLPVVKQKKRQKQKKASQSQAADQTLTDHASLQEKRESFKEKLTGWFRGHW